MADLHFVIRPIELADALYNAVVLSQEHGGKPGSPHVLICYQQGAGGAATGAVLVYGASRLVAGKTTIALETQAPDDYASVVIDREYADKVQSMLRGFGRAKATQVGVRICEEGYDTVEFSEDGEPEVRTVNFSIAKGEEVLVELADSDPDGESLKYFDIVDEWAGTGAALTGPTAFIFEAVKRVCSLKGLGATMMDLGQTVRPHVVAISAGPNFRGILGEIDREVYAGPDGARADHLLN